MDTSQPVQITDQLIESFKPALIFKNFVNISNKNYMFMVYYSKKNLSHDGKYLVAGCEDNSVSLYDLERGDKVNTYYSKRYGVDLVRFTHHNKCILCASKRDNNYRIMYWSLHDNNILCSFIGHTDTITHLDVNPLNSTFVSCSKDNSTRVWEYEKKQCIIDRSNIILKFQRASQFYFTQISNYKFLSNIRVNKSRAACFDNTGNVLACLFVKDGSGSSESSNQIQQIHLFNAGNYESKPFSIFNLEELPEIKFLKFSANGIYIMLGTSENSICLIDAYEGKLMHKFTSNINESGIPLEANFTPDSRYVISGSDNKKIVFWNIETGKETQLMEYHPSTVACVKFSHVYCMLISACQNLVVWIPEKAF